MAEPNDLTFRKLTDEEKENAPEIIKKVIQEIYPNREAVMVNMDNNNNYYAIKQSEDMLMVIITDTDHHLLFKIDPTVNNYTDTTNQKVYRLSDKVNGGRKRRTKRRRSTTRKSKRRYHKKK